VLHIPLWGSLGHTDPSPTEEGKHPLSQWLFGTQGFAYPMDGANYYLYCILQTKLMRYIAKLFTNNYIKVHNYYEIIPQNI
jgi:hypothetical protein